MEKLNATQLENLSAGKDWLGFGAGVACGAAFSGAAFTGIGLAVTGAIFGPTCIGLIIGAVVGKQSTSGYPANAPGGLNSLKSAHTTHSIRSVTF